MSGHHLMSGHLLMLTLALLLTSTTVSGTFPKLISIISLKRIDFGDSVPKHSLLLLHWFANMIEMDNNNVIHLNFEPNRGDYGAHPYDNIEGILDPLPWGYRYYTIGNIYAQSSSLRLPNYVARDNYNLMDYEERNRDRIIVRVREDDTDDPTIDQVYITQHYGRDWEQGGSYDSEHTYQISNNLLREIRLFSTTATVGNQQRSLQEIRDYFGSNVADSQLRELENIRGELACVWLLLFIVIEERLRVCPARREHKEAPLAESVVDISDEEQYERATVRQNTSTQDTRLSECKCRKIVAIIIGIVIVILFMFAL